jgi:hypothetical protein
MLLAMASANVVSNKKINLFSCEASTSRSLKNQQLANSTQQLAALVPIFGTHLFGAHHDFGSLAKSWFG